MQKIKELHSAVSHVMLLVWTRLSGTCGVLGHVFLQGCMVQSDLIWESSSLCKKKKNSVWFLLRNDFHLLIDIFCLMCYSYQMSLKINMVPFTSLNTIVAVVWKSLSAMSKSGPLQRQFLLFAFPPCYSSHFHISSQAS